jgi:hypothetical protein
MFEQTAANERDLGERIGQILVGVQAESIKQIARSFNNKAILKELG